MEFSKDQKTWVAEWIDRQFDQNCLFPCACSAPAKGNPCICTAHIRAYKAWANTPRKRRYIRGWIEEWLGEDQVANLRAELAHRQKRKASTSHN